MAVGHTLTWISRISGEGGDCYDDMGGFFAFCMIVIALLRFFLSIIDRMNKKKKK